MGCCARFKVFRRTGDSGRDHDNIGSGKSMLQSIVLREVAGDFLQPVGLLGEEMLGPCGTDRYRRDVGEIRSNTWGIDHIVESELIDKRTSFQEKGEWL